ncbi:MAG: protein kinase [Alphaproteobacteria bacterium]|nr:protein kinase [Alphaproteobacteria bacterium]
MAIGEWIIEEQLPGEKRYRCHRQDSPFRKAVLRAVRGPDEASIQEEASNLARLQHPNIEAVFGLTTSGDELYLVTEAVQGTSLRSFTAEGGAMLHLRTALELGVQLCEALSVAHERGVVHGDFRPENVLLRPDGRARVGGFELQSSTDDLSRAARYLPPELGHGRRPTSAGDAYALGVVLYELVAGVPPQALRHEDRAALSLDPSFPRGLHDLVLTLTHPDPNVRPSVRYARQVLQDILRDTLGDNEPSGSIDPTWMPDAGPADPALVGSLPRRVGRYEILREVGRGGVGVVYEAKDPELRRRVALKVLLSGTFARAREIQRFKKEAQAVARLDHPGIVKVLDIGSHQDGAWFAMEFVEGPTLLERLRAEPTNRLDWQEAVRIAAGVAHALAHAHEAGVLHRDVKPNNVLLEAGVEPRLADFGLALDAASEHTRLTGTGQVLGTPMYMAPEQAAGDIEGMGPHTDVYGLGVLLYEALTGQVPYEGATPLQIVGKILSGDARSPRELVPELPRTVDTICMKALRLSPRDRYRSAQAFAEDLERCLRGEPILAAEPTISERVRWFVRKRGSSLGVAGLVAAVAVLAVAGVGAVVRFGAARAIAEREHAAQEAWEGARARMERARAEGREDEARTAFQTFVERPEHTGTHALVAAWRAAAEDASGPDQGEERLSALSTAYGVASYPEDQDEALLALARAARDEQRYDLVLSSVDTLRRRGAPSASGPEVRTLQRDALAAHRDLVGATSLGLPSDGPDRVARAFTEATPTALHGFDLRPWPGGGFLWHQEGRFALIGAEPGLPVVRDLHLPVAAAGNQVFPFTTHDGTWLLTAFRDTAATVLAVGPTSVSVDATLPEGELTVATAADLDRDGEDELYYGSWRRLFRLRRVDGRWVQSVPHPETQASNSQIRDLVSTDLDDDGRPELAVAAGEWGAYDVRLLQGKSGSDELRVQAREKLGVVTHLAPIHRPDGHESLLACKADIFPNLRVMPEDAPYGAPRGLWELVLVGGQLRAERIRDTNCSGLVVGDFDGDGMQDVAVDTTGDTFVLIRRPDGGFDSLTLGHLAPLAAAQLDEDGASELVVHDRDDQRIWVLGVGEEHLPVLTPTHPPRAVPPDRQDPTFAAAWNRAEDLVYVGRIAEAVHAHRELATLRYAKPEGLASLLRAADLLFDAGDARGAAELYREADASGSPDALVAAARSLAAARDDRGEREVLVELERRGLLDAELTERAGRLRELDRRPEIAVRFDTPLDPAWQIDDPLSVHRDRARRELVLEGTGDRELARLPLDWDGEWLDLNVDLHIEPMEWDTSLRIGLAPRGETAPMLGFGLLGRGGGEVVERYDPCWGNGTWRDSKGPNVAADVRYGIFLQPDGTAWCTQDGVVSRAESPRHDFESLDGEWDLVILSSGSPSAFAQAQLRSLTIRGATVARGAPGADPLVLALADGDTTAIGPEAPAHLRAVAAAMRVDAADLQRTLPELTDDERRSLLEHLAHVRLVSTGPALRQLLGDDWPSTLANAWASGLYSLGRRHEGLTLALLGHLDKIESFEPRTREEAAELVLLLSRRGAAASYRNVDDVARASLERALTLSTTIDDPDVAALLPEMLADLAEIEVRAGDLARATALARDAVDRATAPLVAHDIVAARPALASLLEDDASASAAALP